jgi:hypothetical protein
MVCRQRPAIGLFTAFALLASAACDAPSPTAAGMDAGADSTILTDQRTANPPLEDADFVAGVTNPYFPLVPGTVFHYRSETPEGVETNDVAVTRDTKQILGVTATVVHDQVFLDGELAEDTFDWFAQDREGNVWYFGEDSREIEDGQVVSTEGSWEAGIGDNEPGIIMLAHPEVGLAYRQEIAPDIAEDMARVLSQKASADVPYGSFESCVGTLEWTLIEPGVREHKTYCPGVGLVLEDQPKGGHIRNELVSISHF